MASARVKATHYFSGNAVDGDRVACRRYNASEVLHVNGRQPVPHPSGRLMSKGERRGYYAKRVTCQGCRRMAKLG